MWRWPWKVPTGSKQCRSSAGSGGKESPGDISAVVPVVLTSNHSEMVLFRSLPPSNSHRWCLMLFGRSFTTSCFGRIHCPHVSNRIPQIPSFHWSKFTTWRKLLARLYNSVCVGGIVRLDEREREACAIVASVQIQMLLSQSMP